MHTSPAKSSVSMSNSTASLVMTGSQEFDESGQGGRGEGSEGDAKEAEEAGGGGQVDDRSPVKRRRVDGCAWVATVAPFGGIEGLTSVAVQKQVNMALCRAIDLGQWQHYELVRGELLAHRMTDGGGGEDYFKNVFGKK